MRKLRDLFAENDAGWACAIRRVWRRMEIETFVLGFLLLASLVLFVAYQRGVETTRRGLEGSVRAREAVIYELRSKLGKLQAENEGLVREDERNTRLLLEAYNRKDRIEVKHTSD